MKKDIKIHENNYIFKYRVSGAIIIDNKLEFKWIPLENLDKENFKPQFLSKQIKEINNDLKHYINTN